MKLFFNVGWRGSKNEGIAELIRSLCKFVNYLVVEIGQKKGGIEMEKEEITWKKNFIFISKSVVRGLRWGWNAVEKAKIEMENEGIAWRKNFSFFCVIDSLKFCKLVAFLFLILKLVFEFHNGVEIVMLCFREIQKITRTENSRQFVFQFHKLL